MTGEDLATLRDQINRRFDSNDEAHIELKALIKFQNGRIRELEVWQSFVRGVTAGVSGAIHFQSLIFGILGGGGVIGIMLLISKL